jgi:arylsulfatase
LRADPWERYQYESGSYDKWWVEHIWTVVPGSLEVAKFLETFKEYPPSQKGGTFGIDQLMEKVNASLSAKGH